MVIPLYILLSTFQHCSTHGYIFLPLTTYMQVDNSDVVVSVISRDLSALVIAAFISSKIQRCTSCLRSAASACQTTSMYTSVWSIPGTETRDVLNLIVTGRWQKGWEKNQTCCSWRWVWCTGLELKVRFIYFFVNKNPYYWFHVIITITSCYVFIIVYMIVTHRMHEKGPLHQCTNYPNNNNKKSIFQNIHIQFLFFLFWVNCLYFGSVCTFIINCVL